MDYEILSNKDAEVQTFFDFTPGAVTPNFSFDNVALARKLLGPISKLPACDETEGPAPPPPEPKMSRTMTIILSIFIALIAPLSATGLLYYGKIDLKKYAIASTFFFLIALIVGVAYATP